MCESHDTKSTLHYTNASITYHVHWQTTKVCIIATKYLSSIYLPYNTQQQKAGGLCHLC